MLNQLDYIYFVYGLSFVLLGIQALKLSGRSDKQLAWSWLAAFGLLHGMLEWLELVASTFGDVPAFRFARAVLMGTSFLALLEFARRSRQAQGSWAPAWWIYLLPAVAMALGLLGGGAGMEVLGRYALGLPAGLLAGWGLWQARNKLPECGASWGLSVAGLAFVAYGFATGLIVPKSGFLPAARLNQEAFLGVVGCPIQVLRTGLALLVVGGMSVSARPRVGNTHSTALHRGLVAAAVVLLLLGGWLATGWRGRKADVQLREGILRQAIEIAETISPEQVKTLSFTAADKGKPAFQRLREQLVLFGQAIRQRSIYSIAMRGDRIVFGPENLEETDPLASPPGTVYAQPTQADWEGLRSGVPFTEGPNADEYGTFVSAFAPVCDPRTHDVLMMVGLDIMVEDWMARITKQRFVAILFTLALVTLVLGGDALLDWRERHAAGHHLLRYTEAILTGTCGLVLTLAGVLIAHDEEMASRRLIFAQLADEHAAALTRVLVELRDLELAGLARFYESSEDVTPQEFHRYAGPLGRDPAIQAFEWIPCVSATEKAQFEHAIRQTGVEGFTIYEKDADGRKIPAAGRDTYYPVLCVEPPAGNQAAIGFDLGSEPVRRAALEEAARNGLSVASDPVNLVQERGPKKGILVFQAVFDDPELEEISTVGQWPGGRVRGFALAVMHLQSALDKAMAESDEHQPITHVDMYQLHTGRGAECLAAWPAARMEPVSKADLSREPSLSLLFPLFVYGKCYLVDVHPGPAFLAAHPARAAGQAGVIGLVLTLVVSGMIGFGVRRRVELEREVLRRTAELEGVRGATEAVQREEMRTRTLLEMIQMTISRSTEEVIDYALEVGIRLTGSKIGYIAFVNDAEDELTMAHWSKSAMAECAVMDKPIVYPLAKTGLWGEALRQRAPIITNDYQAPNPLKKGVPAGHVRIARHMNVPIFDGKKIVAVVGVGNKDDEYDDEDVLQLTVLMDGMWRILCRKRAEAALRDSEERHRVLFESSADAILTLAAPGWSFTAANPAAVQLFGAENEAQLLATTPMDLSPERQPDGEASAAKAVWMIETAMSAGRNLFEWRHKRMNGQEFEATVLLARVHIDQQTFLQCTVRDISEIKRAEQLEQERMNLKQAVDSMGHVLGVVGHELRTPLAGVRAMSEFLMLPGVQQTAEYDKFLKSINVEVVHMAEMVNDLLEAARLSSGTAKWNWSAFRLIDACQEAIDTIRPLVDATAVDLSLEVKPADVAMRGDHAAIRRLVLNLLRNAQKHTSQGAIAVRATFTCDHAGAWIELSVKDTGEGMSTQVAGKLGEAFALNSGMVGDSNVKGSGLGLAICRGIIGAHDGSMAVHSALGEGTEVRVRMRADLEEPVVDREPIQIVRSIKS